MQVRAIEFQENFRLVTLEAARQQSVLNREPAQAAIQAAGTVAEQRLQDLHRPLPADESEQTKPITSEEERSPGRQLDSGQHGGDQSEESADDRRMLPQGKSIDLFA